MTVTTTSQQLASWAKKAREATLRRDELIRRMRDEGSTLRAIAEAAGLSHMGVRKVLQKSDSTREKESDG